MQTVVWREKLRLRIDPNAVRDFSLDFSSWLNGETITDVQITATGMTAGTPVITGSVVSIRLSAATVGCSVRIRLTTNVGQVDEWTIGFDVQEK